jgi:predicted nuclease of predicted toxin-antitoxin system
MRFKTDENLPEECAQVLRDAGWDASSVVQQGLAGSIDPHLLSLCASESRTLITLDAGFGNIKAYPPASHAGVIVLRPVRQDKADVLDLTRRLVEALRSRPIEHELWVVEEQKIRIRS